MFSERASGFFYFYFLQGLYGISPPVTTASSVTALFHTNTTSTNNLIAAGTWGGFLIAFTAGKGISNTGGFWFLFSFSLSSLLRRNAAMQPTARFEIPRQKPSYIWIRVRQPVLPFSLFLVIPPLTSSPFLGSERHKEAFFRRYPPPLPWISCAFWFSCWSNTIPQDAHVSRGARPFNPAALLSFSRTSVFFCLMDDILRSLTTNNYAKLHATTFLI